jgi:hypothetical protein
MESLHPQFFQPATKTGILRIATIKQTPELANLMRVHAGAPVVFED